VRGPILKSLKTRQRVEKKREVTACRLMHGNTPGAICIPRASADITEELFGRRFLYDREATMAAAPTASAILDHG